MLCYVCPACHLSPSRPPSLSFFSLFYLSIQVSVYVIEPEPLDSCPPKGSCQGTHAIERCT